MRLIQPLVLWFCVSLFSPLAQADDKPVMDAKASPEQVSKMLQEAAKSDAAAWKDRPAQGVVNADPKEGGYRLEAVVSGERSAGLATMAERTCGTTNSECRVSLRVSRTTSAAGEGSAGTISR